MAEWWRAYKPNSLATWTVRVDGAAAEYWESYRGQAKPLPLTGTIEDTLRAMGATDFGRGLAPGEHHPRVWRFSPIPGPGAKEAGLGASLLFNVRSSRALFAKMHAIFRYVEPDWTRHQDVYSHEIRELILLACTEVESGWKSVLRANNVQLTTNTSTRDYVVLADHMSLPTWEVRLNGYPDVPPLRPFDGWNATAPTQSLPWYAEYNAVKHDREAAFDRATLRSMITALAAVYVMRIAQFGLDGDEDEADAFSLPRMPTWRASQLYISPHLVDSAGAAVVPSGAWTPRPF